MDQKMNNDAPNRDWECLKSIIARAAPPNERANSSYLEAIDTGDPALIDQRYQLWLEAATDGDEAQADTILAALGISKDELRAGFKNVRCLDNADYPDWINALVDFIAICRNLSSIPAHPLSGTHGNDENFAIFKHIHTYLRRVGHAILGKTTVKSNIVITETARNGFSDMFANRLLNVLGQSIQYELNIAALQNQLTGAAGQYLAKVPDISARGWIERFDRLPGLAYVLGITCAHWRQSVSELLDRLNEDRQILANQLFDGAEITELCEFSGDAGDPHDKGRSVAILQFNNGRKVVYKTKDLRGSKAFMDLIHCLNTATPALKLPTRTILCRGKYGWDEFIEAKECNTSLEVEHYFIRMGMYVRLLQLCEGRDFWLDNLVAQGAFPHFIDLETLLQGREITPKGWVGNSSALKALFDESIVPTAAVASHVYLKPGTPAEDMGSLTPARRLRTPFRAQGSPALDPLFTQSEPDSLVEWRPPAFAPVLNGKPANVSENWQAVLAGYRSMQDVLIKMAPTLLEREGKVLADLKAPVRHIVRDTWSCYHLIQMMLSPRVLDDGITRDIAIARLYRELSPDKALNARTKVIHAEITALCRLDIPLFQSLPEQDQILSSDLSLLGRYFDGTAQDRLKTRLAHITQFDLDHHCDILLSCLETGAAPAPPTVFAPTSSCPKSVDWLETADLIGQDIMNNAVADENGHPCWFGLGYDPVNQVQILQELRRNMLSGTLGLAQFFAALHSKTRNPLYRDLSLDIIQPFSNQADPVATENTPQIIHRHSPLGRFFGVQGEILAGLFCAHHLGNSDLAQHYNQLLASLPITAPSQCDADTHSALIDIGNLSGLLDALSHVSSDPNYVGNIETISGKLLSAVMHCDPNDPGFDIVDAQIKTVPSPLVLTVVALERLSQTHKKTAPNFTPALNKLNDFFAPKIIAGHLSDMSLAGLLESRQLRPLVIQSAQAKSKFFDDSISCLDLLVCCRLALALFKQCRQELYLNQARTAAWTLLQRKKQSYSWFQDRFAADRHNLSLHWGLPAIALTFIELAECDLT
ncbi:type 2 lanthipeptide synthetase LanM [Thalassospira marina]|uniref:Lantibiotic biosynthesis protein dehydration domain-containing protein n=1 Tax=Thalassospira marina TaxID=2048283 RepID=A0ABM6QG67_9PROT|nr:type 2 lanthipeptide synthetase LanM [Thalassospira marina]AUG55581.1 hypothetical protein CSC3H3_22245 [Thalassospira marina]